MKIKHKRLIRVLLIVAVVGLVLCLGIGAVRNGAYAFGRAVSDDERELRLKIVDGAACWIGAQEGTAAHTQLLDIYNSHEPLAQGYTVQPEDEWCCTFVSAVAISCELTDVIPTECGCQRQIELFRELDCWVEADDYEPLPGDIIYYSWKDSPFGDSTGWADHVGIVAGTWHGWIKVIEGNYGEAVACRYIPINAPGIRGFAVPEYVS